MMLCIENNCNLNINMFIFDKGARIGKILTLKLVIQELLLTRS
jgi:hypothetical protein